HTRFHVTGVQTCALPISQPVFVVKFAGYTEFEIEVGIQGVKRIFLFSSNGVADIGGGQLRKAIRGVALARVIVRSFDVKLTAQLIRKIDTDSTYPIQSIQGVCVIAYIKQSFPSVNTGEASQIKHVCIGIVCGANN